MKSRLFHYVLAGAVIAFSIWSYTQDSIEHSERIMFSYAFESADRGWHHAHGAIDAAIYFTKDGIQYGSGWKISNIEIDWDKRTVSCTPKKDESSRPDFSERPIVLTNFHIENFVKPQFVKREELE